MKSPQTLGKIIGIAGTPIIQKTSDSISNNDSQRPMLQNRIYPVITKLIEDAGGNIPLALAPYAPDTQIKFCQDENLCYFGKAPTLTQLKFSPIGRQGAEAWLELQLENLSQFVGCSNKLGEAQRMELAAIIFDTYPYYKLTEFMLFFQRFKRGRYGRFYGAVDPMIILQALDEFDNERNRVYVEKEEEERQKHKEEASQALETVRNRYLKRIPYAGTPQATIDFFQYHLLGFDAMTDEQLNNEIEEIRSGRKTIPNETNEILNLLRRLQ